MALPQRVEKNTPSSPGKYRVLVVDDNRDSAQTIAWTIEFLGHEVEIAHSGEAAIDAAKSFLPHFILLDLGLPGKLNGFDVCESLRKDANMTKSIFVAQTGWGDPEHIRRSKAAGFHHHIVKPVQLAELEKILSSFSDRASVPGRDICRGR